MGLSLNFVCKSLLGDLYPFKGLSLDFVVIYIRLDRILLFSQFLGDLHPFKGLSLGFVSNLYPFRWNFFT